MKILRSARKDRMGEAINIHMIKTINVRVDQDSYYVTVQLRDDDPETWICITNDLPLDKAQQSYNELIVVLRDKSGYDGWTNKWIKIGE